MKSVLARLRPEDISADPFPHLVIRDAVDPTIYGALADGLPTLGDLRGQKQHADNQRFNRFSHDIQSDPKMPSVWKEFSELHTSKDFLTEVLDVFHDAMVDLNSTLESEFGALHDLCPGLRHRDDHTDYDVLMDAVIVANAPVIDRPGSPRGPHIDLPFKLYVGLLYFRDSKDVTIGGDLELYRVRSGENANFSRLPIEGGGHRVDVSPTNIERVKTVSYSPNVLVMFPNSPLSLHSVSPRQPTPFTRYFCGMIADLPRDIFAAA